MRHRLLEVFRCALPFVAAAACTIPSAPMPPAQVFPADARALAYGRTADEVIQNAELRDKIPALFGADWTPASQGRGRIAPGAAAFFGKGGPLRMVSIGGGNYIALTGCAPDACRTRRALLLIREGGTQLLARLDDGAVTHYYAYNGGIRAGEGPPIVDAGLRALMSVGDPYPS